MNNDKLIQAAEKVISEWENGLVLISTFENLRVALAEAKKPAEQEGE